MAQLSFQGAEPGSALMSILCCDEIVPGSEPGYQQCKTIYLAHPLGAKMVDAPIKMALSQQRTITVSNSPGSDCVDAFREEWKRMKLEALIHQHASVVRTYGLGTIILGAVGKEPNKPLKDEDLYKAQLFLNVLDPLNTAGSISMDQDPNSPLFQKWTSVAVNGQSYHRSRACVLMNESPIYIAWTGSAFSFSGRSVYQRALYPLKSFIQTMVTDDMISRKAGLLVAKINPVGAIIDNIMASFAALKRQFLNLGATGGVLSINTGNGTLPNEEIESLNLNNLEGAGGFARTNILKNIATASDMPAWFLENESLTEGFGEGTEDSKNIAKYVDGIREWLQPDYDFLDPIVMRRAWNPDFFAIMQKRYPSIYRRMTYDAAFYSWANSFSATWPNLIKEPESEAVQTEKVKLEGVVSVVEVLQPICGPDNLGKLAAWMQDTVNANKVMFPSPLDLDIDDIVSDAAEKQEQQQALMQQGGQDGDQAQLTPPKPMALKDSSRPFAAAKALADLRAEREAYYKDAAWVESDHPRASDGKFGSGGGGSSPVAHLDTGKLPSPKTVKNSFKSWDEAEAQGRVGREQLSKALSKVASKVGLSDDIKTPDDLTHAHETNGKSYVFLGPNKGKEKASAKVAKDYGGDWGSLKDMVRATIAVEHPDQLKDAIDQVLAAGIEFAAQPKDNVEKGTEAGYRDVNTLIRLPNGMIAELQFHVKSMVVAKQAGHAFYDQQILMIQDHGGAPRSEWPAADRDAYDALNGAQQAIYNPAWERASKSPRPSSTELQPRISPPPKGKASEPRPRKE